MNSWSSSINDQYWAQEGTLSSKTSQNRRRNQEIIEIQLLSWRLLTRLEHQVQEVQTADRSIGRRLKCDKGRWGKQLKDSMTPWPISPMTPPYHDYRFTDTTHQTIPPGWPPPDSHVVTYHVWHTLCAIRVAALLCCHVIVGQNSGMAS